MVLTGEEIKRIIKAVDAACGVISNASWQNPRSYENATKVSEELKAAVQVLK